MNTPGPRRERLPEDCLYPSRPLSPLGETLLDIRAWRMYDRRVAPRLHRWQGRLELLTRRGKGSTERLDLGSDTQDPLLTALARVPDLLTFPAEAAVEITCLAELEERVAELAEPFGEFQDAWTLLGDEHLPPQEDWDEEDLADHAAGHDRVPPHDERIYARYDDLAPLLISINGVPYLAAQVAGRCTLIPMDPGQDSPPLPLVRRVHATYGYAWDGGSPASNNSWWEGAGEVRTGLHIAWAAYNEGGYVMIGRGTAEEFMAEVHASDFFANSSDLDEEE
ncbi:hypothetical protein HD597_012316 [Nonomuraea thailandensis]|uniref:Uncharacterized protein n=1 Tax=Nonomuraea thailandensis TaxID=1188745 RepID=A0A9X2H0U1_9ACTN|nr:hypothetical protein [Nonomuraea thailandensis]MCP2365296.1 hypothetical protein [Nonomuraea thailandensis]